MDLWIARDFDNDLFLYDEEPSFNEGNSWVAKNGVWYTIDNNLFPEVTFENSPQKVELKLVTEIVDVAESPLKTFPRVNEFEVGASYRR